MYKLLPLVTTVITKLPKFKVPLQQTRRTFLSQSYYCNDTWESRTSSPAFQNINPEEFYHSLDQRYQKTRKISAVDVDIFANLIKDEYLIEEMLDLIHKLRMSAETGNALDSMTHAAVRVLLKYKKEGELLNVLDDRLNYGLFLDTYTANLLLDYFWKNKDHASGARVAALQMLQDDLSDPLTSVYSLLHCYNYLLKPVSWLQSSTQEAEEGEGEEEEEEVKVRVKFLRNPYYDDHFDITEPDKLIGKTLVALTKNKNDLLGVSFNILGLALHQKLDLARKAIKNCVNKNLPVSSKVLELIPDSNEIKNDIHSLKLEPEFDVQAALQGEVSKIANEVSESCTARQARVFEEWESKRQAAIAEQKERLLRMKRLEDIEALKKGLKDKETKLWFFENEEQIELDIEAKKVYYPKRWFGKKKKPRKVDVAYVPPEVNARTQ